MYECICRKASKVISNFKVKDYIIKRKVKRIIENLISQNRINPGV